MRPSTSSGSKAHKLTWIGWRMKKFTQNLLFHALAEYDFFELLIINKLYNKILSDK